MQKIYLELSLNYSLSSYNFLKIKVAVWHIMYKYSQKKTRKYYDQKVKWAFSFI